MTSAFSMAETSKIEDLQLKLLNEGAKTVFKASDEKNVDLTNDSSTKEKGPA